jgi:hypothetical protein
MDITRVDTDGVRAVLQVGQLAVDNYEVGEDIGRIWTGNGDSNRALAFKDECVLAVAGKTGNVVLSKEDVGLGNVNNTSDLDKPVSSAVKIELDNLKEFKQYVTQLHLDTNELSGYVRENKDSTGVMEIVCSATGELHRIDQNGIYTKVTNPTSFYDGASIVSNVLRIQPVSTSIPIKVYSQGTPIVFDTTQEVQLDSNYYFLQFIVIDHETLTYRVDKAVQFEFFGEEAITSLLQIDEVGNLVQFCDERHGIQMDGATHYYHHMTVGTEYLNGLGVAGLTLGSTTHGMFEAGMALDEDMPISIVNQDSAKWYYRDGVEGIWKLSETSDNSVAFMESGSAVYNKFDGTTWSKSVLASGEYTHVIYASTNNKLSMFVKIPTQTKYSSLEDAYNNVEDTLNSMNMEGLPTPEYLVLGIWIVDNTGALASLTTSTHMDLRKQKLTGVNGATGITFDHRNLGYVSEPNLHPGESISLSIDGYGDITNVKEFAVDVYDKLDNGLEVNNSITLRAGTTADISTWLPESVGEIVFSIDEQRHMYYNELYSAWMYLGNIEEVKVNGVGTGPAGVFTESWEDYTTITDKWTSSVFGNLQDGSDTGLWNRHRYSTPSTGTGPSSAYDGTWYLYTEMSSSGHIVNYDLSTTNFAKATKLEFAYHLNGDDCGTFNVSVTNNDNSAVIYEVSGDQGSDWHTVTLDLTSSNAEKITFNYSGAKSWESDLALDKIIITSV